MSSVSLSLEDIVRDGHPRGWSFTPLDMDPSCASPGKKPRDPGWQKAAREALEQAVEWAGQGNVGVRTGSASGGLVVIDVDLAKGATLDGMRLPPTVTVKTGGHGLHFYYRTDERIGNRANKLGPHIDVRGEGGQVVAAGSVHMGTGCVYEYEDGMAPWEIDVAPLPAEIAERIRAPKAAAAADGPPPPIATPKPDAGPKTDRYATGALRAELKNIAVAIEGSRNIALNKAAFVLGQFIGAGRLDRAEVERLLLENTTLPTDEASKTVRSGLEAGIQQPRAQEAPLARKPLRRGPSRPPPTDAVPTEPPALDAAFGPHAETRADDGPPAPIVAGVNGPGDVVRQADLTHPPDPLAFPAPPNGEAVTPEQAGAYKLLTDLGNAERLVRRHGENLRWVAGPNRWHVWDGRRWAPDIEGLVIGLCKETALSIFAEASRSVSEAVQREVSSWAIKSQSRDRLSAMEYLARHRLAVKATALDADPWLLNAQNGTIDLRTGAMREHRRSDLISRAVPVSYDPNATCPRWLQFLCEVQPDAGVRVFIQRWLGHGCTGDVREQYLPIFWGEGNNGKNVLLDTVCAVMGDYAAEAPPDLLTAGGGGGDHPTDIADLLGRRLVIASETEAYARLRVQLMKRITGNAKLKGRYMRQDFIEFDRTHKMVLATNNKPQITETTEAVWRRIRLVNFGVIISGDRIDKSLMLKLKPEYPGILAWLVQGAADWLREGLTEPAAVMAATAEYRNKSDVFADFAQEHIRIAPDGFASSDELRKTYEGFCKATGCDPCTPGEFRDKVAKLGAKPGKTPAKRGWVGIKLL